MGRPPLPPDPRLELEEGTLKENTGAARGRDC